MYSFPHFLPFLSSFYAITRSKYVSIGIILFPLDAEFCCLHLSCVLTKMNACAHTLKSVYFKNLTQYIFKYMHRIHVSIHSVVHVYRLVCMSLHDTMNHTEIFASTKIFLTSGWRWADKLSSSRTPHSLLCFPRFSSTKCCAGFYITFPSTYDVFYQNMISGW